MRHWEFDYATEVWKEPVIVGVVLGDVIGRGGFREARKGKVGGNMNMVIKTYLSQSKEDIGIFGLTTERHGRLSIQMQSSAAYISSKFNERLMDPEIRFSYLTASLGEIMDGELKDEIAMIEPYVEGQFTKYVNNDGNINPAKTTNLFQDVAETLCHFSYEHSGMTLLIDLQGFGLQLTDPEIASVSTKEVLFCNGNNQKAAFKRFFEQHRCNKYCNEIGLNVVDFNAFLS